MSLPELAAAGSSLATVFHNMCVADCTLPHALRHKTRFTLQSNQWPTPSQPNAVNTRMRPSVRTYTTLSAMQTEARRSTSRCAIGQRQVCNWSKTGLRAEYSVLHCTNTLRQPHVLRQASFSCAACAAHRTLHGLLWQCALDQQQHPCWDGSAWRDLPPSIDPHSELGKHIKTNRFRQIDQLQSP
jgi:hypothetical protein